MKISSILAVLAFTAALPATVHAEQFNGIASIASSNLTWNVVKLSKPLTTPGLRSSNQWFEPIEHRATALMGLYLGEAGALPRSIVGWDYHQDIVSRVRYGIYLVNRF